MCSTSPRVTPSAKVSAVADARQWLQGHAIDMQLPVIYRLLDH